MAAETPSPSPRPEAPGRDPIDCDEVPHYRKRSFVVKFPRGGRVVTLTLLWTTSLEWPTLPESAAGSPWTRWRIGPFTLAFHIDG